ncbi:MAG: hypothetical protein HY704_08875 [Gemmatimonadetes bacterium]|nr:hypothetical protein [Gemmatimonadota bacterium]
MTRNLWHSCGRYRLADHFAGKDPLVRRLFDRFCGLVKVCGPVTVYAQKTRIVFQARMRFGGAVVRRQWLDVTLVLRRRRDAPQLRRIELIPPIYHVHHFRIREPGELDEAFAALVREAYRVGVQEHLAS